MKIINKFLLLIIIASLFLSIGYASINSISLDIKGKTTAKASTGLVITEVNKKSSNNSSSELITAYNTNIQVEAILNDIDSNVVYEIKMYNGTEFSYKYIGVEYIKEYYDNDAIQIEVIDTLEKIHSGETKTFRIKISYKSGTNISAVSNELNGLINLKFIYIDKILNDTDPIMADGMIPVQISDNGSVKTANLKDDWYNYSKQKWANTILVKESSRSKYVGLEDVTVSQSDILAYYVWIPRFKYEIWYDGSSSNNPKTINIVFHDKSEKSTGTTKGSYLTPPAFWWDRNSDSSRTNDEEINGFWVGKFETSKGTSSDVGTSNPVILPNKSSWVSQTVSPQFTTLLKFAGGTLSNGSVTFSGNNLYGLTSEVDSHMIKNTQWAAMAYLSHSKYGINKEVRINNYYSSGFLTGCGASADNAGKSTTCSIKYGNATSYPQSTTGNISGIFDTSGGAWERIMANYNKKISSSEFNTLPPIKYYDLYTLSSLSACTMQTCGGHALHEVEGWYSDLNNLIASNYPWKVRSGGYEDGATAGIFNFGRNAGQATNLSSMRSVLIVE